MIKPLTNRNETMNNISPIIIEYAMQLDIDPAQVEMLIEDIDHLIQQKLSWNPIRWEFNAKNYAQDAIREIMLNPYVWPKANIILNMIKHGDLKDNINQLLKKAGISEADITAFLASLEAITLGQKYTEVPYEFISLIASLSIAANMGLTPEAQKLEQDKHQEKLQQWLGNWEPG